MSQILCHVLEWLPNPEGDTCIPYGVQRNKTRPIQLALGYDFHINPTLTLTPWVGIGYHSQDLRMTDGRQTISDEDDLGPFSGLNSSYDAKWIGALVGLDASIRLSERSRLILGGRFEYSQYEADAVWNLRDDLPTFTHTATGMGIRWVARWEWDFRPQWTLFASVSGASFETGKGTDRSQFSDGSAETTRMNGATWKSIGIQAGVTYRF